MTCNHLDKKRRKKRGGGEERERERNQSYNKRGGGGGGGGEKKEEEAGAHTVTTGQSAGRRTRSCTCQSSLFARCLEMAFAAGLSLV